MHNEFRKWMRLVAESRVTLPARTGEVTVWENPSRSQFAALIGKSQHEMLRGFLTDDGVLIVWDAALACHIEFFDYFVENTGRMPTCLGLGPDTVFTYNDDEDGDIATAPAILRAYGSQPRIVNRLHDPPSFLG